jgi:hypothetical protein
METTRILILLAGTEGKVRLTGRLVVGPIVLVNAMSFGRILMVVKVMACKMRGVHDVGRSRCPHDGIAHKTRVAVADRHVDKDPSNESCINIRFRKQRINFNVIEEMIYNM